MWGIAVIQMKESPGFTGLGFLFFVLFYLNGLRQQYFYSIDPAAREILKNTLSNAGLLGAPLFGVFILAFGIGNLCYGLSLYSEKGFGKILSVLLILWSVGCFLALGNNFWRLSSLNTFIEKYNYTYQPLMRILLAI